MNTIDLQGRSAIVTGGAQGIGLGIARRLLASDARVLLWDRDEPLLRATCDDLQTEGGGEPAVSGDAVDVTDAGAVADAMDRAVATLGAVDILVNNAGIGGPNVPTWEYPLDAWRQVIDIDLSGVFYGCRAVLPHMIARNYGRIVNVASIAGKEGNPNAVAYSSAKAGVIALTKSVAKETADKDIAVNCITPAVVETRILEQCTQAHIDYMLSKIPRGRFLTVDEAAAMVAWLVSEENAFTTGAAFDLSGGRATY